MIRPNNLDYGALWIGRQAFRRQSCSGRGPGGPTDIANAPNGSNIGWDAASSLHPGGAMVTMADGSVHFISDNIGLQVFSAMCAKQDGFAFGSFQQ